MLSHYDNKKLEKFDIKNEEEAKNLVRRSSQGSML